MKTLTLFFFLVFTASTVNAQTSSQPTDTLRLHVLNWEEHKKFIFTDSVSEFILLKTYILDNMAVQIFFEKEIGATTADLEKSGVQACVAIRTKAFYYFTNDTLAETLVAYSPTATINRNSVESIPVMPISLEELLLNEKTVSLLIMQLHLTAVALVSDLIEKSN